MPSPFPGVDPYLEAPALWRGVHGRLAVHMGDVLSEALGGRYFVDVEERVYVLEEDDPAQRFFIPDAVISARRRRREGAPAETGPSPETGSVAPAVLFMVEDVLEVREPRLVIQDVEAREVVTVVEVLSAANKALGSRGRSEYLAKRREVLRSPIHLVEIDLLRAGARFPSLDPLPPGDYYIHVSRAAGRPRGEVYAWPLRRSIPVVPVPLREGDADARLDVAEALRRTYEQAHYERRIDYAAPPPPPPLPPDDAAWLDARLREAGLRASA